MLCGSRSFTRGEPADRCALFGKRPEMDAADPRQGCDILVGDAKLRSVGDQRNLVARFEHELQVMRESESLYGEDRFGAADADQNLRASMLERLGSRGFQEFPRFLDRAPVEQLASEITRLQADPVPCRPRLDVGFTLARSQDVVHMPGAVPAHAV